MGEVASFGWVVLGVSVAAAVAILSNRLSQWIRVPAPALFLVGAAVASDIFPALNVFEVVTVQRVVTVALVLILFDGGMHIGWRRFRSAAGAIVWLGLAGTAVTAAAVALLAHLVLQQVPVSRDTVLVAGDEVLALTDTSDGGQDPVAVFGRTLSRGHP